ncbi:MAG: efflux RND transporter periplasmic adaptor subunit [Proteobacteria bacterium]|nr:efflux RND transporter periplasmic adaptor subunit [Pseudomonadota bacterium]
MPNSEHIDQVMKPGRIWSGLVVAAIFITACGDDGKSADKSEDEEVLSIPVETVRPSRGDIVAMYSGTAPIEAFADAAVIAKVGGEVTEILVEEGDDVVSGQILARLDGDRLRLESQQAEANLRKLERDYQRNVDLKDKALISAGDFEKIQYEMEALQASFDLARLEYGYTEIRAPIDGVISERFIKLGNTIDLNARTFHVTSLEPLVSYLHIPEREYRRIDPGQAATIGIDALQGASFEAAVARISPVVDPETGTFKITIEVSDPSRHLKPGMFGRIGIVYDTRQNVLQIPRSAIIEEAGSSTVFVVTDAVVEKRDVRTGYTQGGLIEVQEGIDDDDEIVSVGHTNLKNGSKVSVIKTIDAVDLNAATIPSTGGIDN